VGKIASPFLILQHVVRGSPTECHWTPRYPRKRFRAPARTFTYAAEGKSLVSAYAFTVSYIWGGFETAGKCLRNILMAP
jgi:hypothetical protein